MKRPWIFTVTLGVFSPDRFEACSVWVEGIHAEDSDPVLQKFRGHVSGEIWVAEVGIGS